MEPNPTFLEAIKVLGYVFGTGGVTAITVAIINARKPREPAKIEPAAAVAIETPWLIQTLTRIQMDVEGIREAVDTNTAVISTASIQMNAAAAAAVGRRRRRNKRNTS